MAAPLFLRPVDTAPRDPSLVAFRKRLLDALRRRDEAAIRACLHPSIRFSFGDEPGGPDAFLAAWKRRPNGLAALDAALGATLRLGGDTVNEAGRPIFWAPYIYARWPRDLDAFENAYAVVPDAPIYAGARKDAAVVARVRGYGRVALVSPPAPLPGGWRRVKTRNGVVGYSPPFVFWSSVDWRAGLEKEAGNWRVTIFVSGD